jgi:hypothetical protein
MMDMALGTCCDLERTFLIFEYLYAVSNVLCHALDILLDFVSTRISSVARRLVEH